MWKRVSNMRAESLADFVCDLLLQQAIREARTLSKRNEWPMATQQSRRIRNRSPTSSKLVQPDGGSQRPAAFIWSSDLRWPAVLKPNQKKPRPPAFCEGKETWQSLLERFVIPWLIVASSVVVVVITAFSENPTVAKVSDLGD